MRVVISVLFFLGISWSLLAQDATTGACSGTVRDTAGRPIAGAQILAASTPQRIVYSGNNGTFYLSGLTPGSYPVAVTAPGFAPEHITSVMVELGTTTQLPVVLRIASVNVVVHVNVAAPMPALVDPDAAPTSQTISPDEVEDLPLDGRRWQSFVQLAPTVTTDDSSQLRISFGGMAVTQNSLVLDGFDDNQSFHAGPRGGARAAFRVPQSAVREFRVHPADYTTALGRAAGGVITTISQRGTHRRSGSAFFQYRDTLFAATDPLAIATHYNGGAITSEHVRPKDLRLQWGVVSSGLVPLAMFHEQLFYLAAFEQQRRSFPAMSTPSNTNFYSLTAIQTALLQTRGVTLPQIGTALSYLDSLTGTVPRRADQTVFFPRLDWDHNSHDQYTLTWNRARWNSPAGVRTRATVARGATSFGDDQMSSDDVNLRWTRTITPYLVNNAGIGASRDFERQQAQTSLPQEPHTGPNGYAPQVSIAGEFTFGKPATLGRKRYPDERRLQFFDTLSWAGPASLLQAGIAVSLLQEHIETLQNEEGSYSYSSGTTSGHAGGLVDWITDFTFSSTAYPNGACPAIYASLHYFCFHAFTQSFGKTSTAWNTAEWAAFVQQHWRPSTNFTVDAGVRYEYLSLPVPQRPNAAIDAQFGEVASTSTLPSDTNNLAPRVAIAWTPSRRQSTAIRLSYGLYFGRIPGATIWSALSRTAQPTSTSTLRITPTTINTASCFIGYPDTYQCATNGTVQRTTTAILFGRRFQAPMSEHAQLSMEHQIHSLLLSAGYLGAASRQLPNSTDLNIVQSTQQAAFRVVRSDPRAKAGVRNGDLFTVPLYLGRISSDFGSVTEILSNASAISHAFVLTARRPMTHGFSFRSSWTYGKMLDYGQDHAALPDIDGQFDPYNVRYDRAASDLDHRHRVVASVLLQPKIDGAGMLHALENNWSLAAIFTASSGRPYSYLIDGGTELPGGRQSINGSGGLRYLPSVGRNTLRFPWSQNLDLRLARQLRLTSKLHARIYADAFNIFNHVNVTRVQQRAFLVGDAVSGVTPLVYQDAEEIAAEGLNAQPFGTVTNASTQVSRQREVQFGMRVEW